MHLPSSLPPPNSVAASESLYKPALGQHALQAPIRLTRPVYRQTGFSLRPWVVNCFTCVPSASIV